MSSKPPQDKQTQQPKKGGGKSERGAPGSVMAITQAARKERFLQAYRVSSTILRAALHANVSRETVLLWRQRDPEFLARMLQAETESVEMLETKAHAIANAGDGEMIRFLLKCKKRDVYSDRIRHEFEEKTMDLLISEIVVVLQKRIPQFCPHCRTGMDISPLIAQDLLEMSAALVAKKAGAS